MRIQRGELSTNSGEHNGYLAVTAGFGLIVAAFYLPTSLVSEDASVKPAAQCRRAEPIIPHCGVRRPAGVGGGDALLAHLPRVGIPDNLGLVGMRACT